MRVLREYQRTAMDFHQCDTCMNDIEPGDLYRGTVYVNEKKREYRMMVLKQHLDPPCPEGYHEEIENAITEGMRDEKLGNLETEVKKAA